MITLQNPLGTISMNADYFAELVSLAARSCYGVAGMATGGAHDDFKSLFFGSDFPEKGVRVTQSDGKLTIDVEEARDQVQRRAERIAAELGA